jgi:hypothetical protein
MSWHTSGIMIQVDRSDNIPILLDELGFPGAEYIGPISFDDATSVFDFSGSLGLSVATVDGWTSIWGPIVVADEDALVSLSRQGRVFTCIMEGASGTYSFAVYENGSRLRQWMEQEGKVYGEEGEPLVEELEIFARTDDREGRILLLLEALTLPLGRLSDINYDSYRLPF